MLDPNIIYAHGAETLKNSTSMFVLIMESIHTVNTLYVKLQITFPSNYRS